MSTSAHASHRRRRAAARRPRPTVGAPPGSYSLDLTDGPSELRLITYDPEHLEERAVTDLAELSTLRAQGRVVWIDTVGLNRATAEALAASFGLHPLAVEDAVHSHQRAKLDQYPEHDFLSVRSVMAIGDQLHSEQVSLFIGDGFVITVQERQEDPFLPVRDRLRSGRGRIRQRGTDYLAYALLDALVDQYFPVLEQLGDRLEALEDDITFRDGDEHVPRIHELRRALVDFRRSVWPLRDVLAALSRGGEGRFGEETRLFLRDTQDHVLRVIDLLESYREMAASLMDLHLSMTGQRTNEVMQVLTVIATIFIPLTFIAGVYGMNFDTSHPLNMPETRWPWGYPAVMILMAVIAGALLLYFRRRGWLRGRRARRGDDD